MVWLQLSANSGPAECCLALRKALARILAEAAAMDVQVDIVEEVDGPLAGTLRSVLVELTGSDGAPLRLAERWSGSLLWICESPYRKRHKRKNWFLNAVAFDPPPLLPATGLIRYEATRASGPGGQHVNKTDSAIRATHVETGLSVKVQAGRSQHANKRLAAQLLASKLAARIDTGEQKLRAQRRQVHHQAERGNASRIFVGPAFIEQ